MKHWESLAGAALRALWGKGVTCTITEALREDGRNRAYRLGVNGAPVSSVILKASVGDENDPYTPGDDRPWSPFSRFCNEWAGCEMLAPLGLGPRAFTGSAEHGFYLMEDLGNGQSLADRLTGQDPEAATAALFAYARSLGAMHAATRGQEAHWLELRAGIGGTAAPQPFWDSWARDVEAFKAILGQYGVDVPSSLNAETERIASALERPGAYLAFTPSDCCPDNHFLRGDRVVFFDCEGATMRHALLDAAYLLAPFPTCWCMGRLPENLPEQLIAAYREAFPGGADFEAQLTLALASWVIGTMTWTWVGNWQAEDRTWGLVTVRQRHLYRLENLLARANLRDLLPGLAEAAASLKAALETQ